MIAIDATDETLSSRDELIMEHLPQVKLIASRIHKGVPPSVSLEDLISAGTLGLISAIDRYDSTHGVKLKTYAEHKIRGAILDSLRVLDWAPRQKRRRAKMIENAIQELEKTLGRVPVEEEIAAQLDLSVQQYQDWLAETRGMTVASLEPGDPEKSGADLLRYVFDSEDKWPSRILERAELERLLARALAGIPKLEQTILALYYYEELTLREISKVVELHESRVSQLKSQAILRLRAHLQSCWPQQGVLMRQPERAA
ncbi:MAG TPA: FliA/WhiG family RNA polymerase sigma factor [Bryobacteraceae bacterium]|nr:FliA/WhiG family RNA polymerase sigma factor [Bryobacteraceae bacterium]